MSNTKYTNGDDGGGRALLEFLKKAPGVGKKQLLAGVAAESGIGEATLGSTLSLLLREKTVRRKGLRYYAAEALETAPAVAEGKDGKPRRVNGGKPSASHGEEDTRAITEAVIAYLRLHPGSGRKELLDGALERFALSPAEKKDDSPRSRKNQLRNGICRAMRSLTEEGVLKKEQMLYSLNGGDTAHANAGVSQEQRHATPQKPKNTVPPKSKTRAEQTPAAIATVAEPRTPRPTMTKRHEGELALKAVREYLTAHPASTRQRILAGAIEHCGLTPAELKDTSPQGPAIRLRSRIGQVLTDLLSAGEAVKQGQNISLRSVPKEASCKSKKLTRAADQQTTPTKKQTEATKKQTETAKSVQSPKSSNEKKNKQTAIKRTDPQRAAEAVIEYLSAHPGATRKAILDGAIATYGLTEAEMNQRNPSSKYVRTGSYVGSALTALIEQGSIVKSGGEHRLAADSYVLVRETECEEAVRRLLKKKKYSGRELLHALSQAFGTTASASPLDEADLKKTAERVVEKLIASGEVVNGDGGVLCMVKPLTSEKVMSEKECQRQLMAQLVARDGRFFERFLANALEKHFLISGRNVTYCNIPGGSADGGIDVEIHTVDELGFSEQILVQAKCRESMHVTEKEVREFYGALHAQKGSRGIYATTSTFHPAAQKLLDGLDNCVGIDGDRLFEILKRAEYGVKLVKNGYTIDPSVF